jgi:diguanylate cyclase
MREMRASGAVSFETASEHLRLALPLMSKFQVPVVPVNYAVWYEYVAGTSPVLKEAIDRLVGANQIIDESVTRELYRRHVDPADPARVEAAQQTVKRLLEAMSVSLDAAGSEVSRYERALKDSAAELSQDIAADELRGVVARLLTSTERMNVGNAALAQHLADSRQEADALRQELARVKVEACSDPLTGLANRKGFDERLQALASTDDYAIQTHSLFIGDIDKFKHVNDTYGHLFGDKIIRTVAKAFASSLKGKDIAARFGGEEFVVFLPETALRGALAVAESIRNSIERGRVFNPKTGAEIGRVTISIGVTELGHGEAVDAALERADEALYRAKECGRNRVEALVATAPVRAAG